ncbi:DUF2956 family protein [Spirosoma flavum]|uniref:DUF2956 family protein n=1 Tax=Spirosoma flavum TaxID=2048557 RepID=A0ABW6ALH3_9BACT
MQPDANQPAIQNEASQPAGLTNDEIDARIADGIAKGLALYQQQEAEKKELADLAEKRAQENAQKALNAAKAKVVATTWPYGNKDKENVFDLSLMTNWTELPADKVVIVLAKYNVDGAGNKIGFDVKNSLIQPIDPVAHKAQITPDKKTGSTTYSMLGVDPIVVHDPSKQ